jgi:hypothetical protein
VCDGEKMRALNATMRSNETNAKKHGGSAIKKTMHNMKTSIHA